MINTIKNIAINQLDERGYKKIISLLFTMVNRYNWPKTVLEDYRKSDHNWSLEEIIALTHQLLIFIQKEGKLEHIEKIPDNYLEYYFHQIIVTYIASNIHEYQTSRGISHKSVRRILLGILNENYFKAISKGHTYWSESKENSIGQVDKQDYLQRLEYLPKIYVRNWERQYKKYVQKAVKSIFSLGVVSIEENILVDATYKLFDQINSDEEPEISTLDNIDRTAIRERVKQILGSIEESDLQIMYDYYLTESRMTIRALGEKYSLPKSNIQMKLDKIRKSLIEGFTPSNQEEGIYFLDILKDELDKMQ